MEENPKLFKDFMKTIVNKESFGTLGKEFHDGIIDYF